MTSGRSVSAVLSALLLAGCAAADTSPEVRLPGEPNGTFSGAMRDMRTGEPTGARIVSLCVDGADTGLITSVDVPADSGAEVTAFAVVTGPSNDMAVRGTLENAGYDTTHHGVNGQCGETGEDANGSPRGFSTLMVQLERTHGEVATIEHFEVHWEAGDEQGTLDYPFEFLICESDVSCLVD